MVPVIREAPHNAWW